jgi:hypothetical protein
MAEFGGPEGCWIVDLKVWVQTRLDISRISPIFRYLVSPVFVFLYIFFLKKAIVVTVVLCSDMQPFHSLPFEGKIIYWKYGRGDVSIVAEDSPTSTQHFSRISRLNVERKSEQTGTVLLRDFLKFGVHVVEAHRMFLKCLESRENHSAVEPSSRSCCGGGRYRSWRRIREVTPALTLLWTEQQPLSALLLFYI